MTPVQLPEVPAPNRRAFYVCTKCGYMGSFGPVHRPPDALTPGDCGYLAATDGDTYTAAQLREYATEACRPLLDALEEIANYPELDALELKRIARAVLTPSETNSER